MDPILFASFIAATLLIIVPPGPSCALASSQAIRHGKRTAVLTIMGDALGSVVHIIIAVAGLSVLIGIADVVLPYLQIAGGVFILHLAYRSFFGDYSIDDTTFLNADRAAFIAGFFACVTNPKAIVFFVALFPGFLSPDHNIVVQSLIYGLIFVVLDGVSIFAYAMAALYLATSDRVRRFDIDKVSGLGLCGVGLVLIVKGYREIPAD